jgi:hypothetical protein
MTVNRDMCRILLRLPATGATEPLGAGLLAAGYPFTGNSKMLV